jgi:hypothetical protein
MRLKAIQITKEQENFPENPFRRCWVALDAVALMGGTMISSQFKCLKAINHVLNAPNALPGRRERMPKNDVEAGSVARKNSSGKRKLVVGAWIALDLTL